MMNVLSTENLHALITQLILSFSKLLLITYFFLSISKKVKKIKYRLRIIKRN